MKRKLLAITLIIAAIIVTSIIYVQYRNAHTFILSSIPSEDSYLKTEQIQPIFGTVKVWGAQDTDVWFTDVENSENKFQIGYITSGMSETIKLEKGKWYFVDAAGEITVQMVNISIP